MASISELIKSHFDELFLKSEDLRYLGELRELEKETAKKSAVLFCEENFMVGSVTTDADYKSAEIVYNHERDNLGMKISENQIDILIKPPAKLPKDFPHHRHPLKHDWLVQEPTKISQSGDYKPHLKNIKEAFEKLEQGQKSVKLYLPQFL